MKLKIPSRQFREATISIREIDGGTDFTMSISSEEPVLRYDWFSGKEYWEVLDHSRGGFDASRLNAGLPILFNHDFDDHLALAKSWKLEDGKIVVSDFVWSESDFAKTKRADAENGSLPYTSVGYELTGEAEKIGEKDGKPILKFKWAPYEASLVAVPADINVGVGRKEDANERTFDISIDETALDKNKNNNTPETNTNTMKHVADSRQFRKQDGTEGGSPEHFDTNGKINVDEIRFEAQKLERERVKGIQEITSHLREKRGIDCSEAASKFISEGKSLDEFRHYVLTNEFNAVPVMPGDGNIGASEKEARKFSILKAIRDISTRGKLEGLEAEMSEAAYKALRRQPESETAFIIPCEVERHHTIKRAIQSAGVFTEGGATVATELGEIIEMLRNDTVLGRLGMTIISGLVGDVAFPVQTGGCVAYWLSETGQISDSAATFAQKVMTPHRLGASIPFTNQFVAQTSIDAEAWLLNEINTQMGIVKDKAGLHGTGSDGQPLGISNTDGVNKNVTFAGTASWSNVVKFETELNTENANIGEIAWALSSGTVGKWKTIEKIPTGNQGFLIDLTNPISANGYRIERTNQISGDIVFFGVWSQLLHGVWSGREIIVDPYSLKKSGQIEITVNEMVDFLVRQPKCFVLSTDSGAQ